MIGTAAPAGFATTLPVRGRRVVVAGGGSQALGPVAALRAGGAHVLVVSRELAAALEELADRGDIGWLPRDLAAADLDDAWLVVDCTDDPGASGRLREWSQARRLWCLDHAPPARPRQGTAATGTGRVVLVGGGPGDPGLLTVAGLRALHEADVVVTDRLAPVAVLDELRPGVEVVDVSKVPRGPTTSQDRINELLVSHAKAGKVVVRLKGGDSFLFGRGMEEAVACAAADVPVQVVPGVTSATAVPALAGIPVTHRGLSQGVTVVSGHVPPGDPRSALDWSALARTGTTLVLLMAVENLQLIAVALLAGGLPAGTPVACVEDGTLPSQRVVSGTLADIAARAREVGLRPPAVTIVGEVAAFARPGSPLAGPDAGPTLGGRTLRAEETA